MDLTGHCKGDPVLFLEPSVGTGGFWIFYAEIFLWRRYFGLLCYFVKTGIIINS